MVKSEFISAIAEKANCSKKEADTFVSALGEVLMEVIANEDKVKIADVMTVGGKTTSPRKARNPKTGECVNIPEKHGQPWAKFSKTAKE